MKCQKKIKLIVHTDILAINFPFIVVKKSLYLLIYCLTGYCFLNLPSTFAAAPLAWATVSGISFGPNAAPAK